MTYESHVDVVLIGGGIAGLWLHNLLTARGYTSVLIEKDQLGSGQTLASQGMIHGGIKYALNAGLTQASETIASMPARWAACMAGEDPVDLRGVKALSQDYYLFSDASLTSKITAFFGSKAVKGRVNRLDREAYPEVFRTSQFKGSLYRLQDIVVDAPSLINHLATCHPERIIKGDPEFERLDGDVGAVTVNNQRISANHYILCAGAGNQKYIEQLGLPVTMQLRPLHQVVIKGELPPIFAHAVSLKSGDKPRVTFTSHPLNNGNAWYLGGAIAETGVNRSEQAQIEFARKEMADLLPWISFEHCEFSTLHIDRAEAGQTENLRPDAPYAARFSNTIVCWPTKLTLAPMLGDEVTKMLGATTGGKLSGNFEPAKPGAAPWL